jgi:hypothetical protein
VQMRMHQRGVLADAHAAALARGSDRRGAAGAAEWGRRLQWLSVLVFFRKRENAFREQCGVISSRPDS